MKKVLYYRLKTTGETLLQLPIDAEVLSARERANTIALWVSGDESLPTEARKFNVLRVDGHIEEGFEFIGSCVRYDDPSNVLQVFEDIRF